MARRLIARRGLAAVAAGAVACALTSTACDVLTGGCGDELEDVGPVEYSDGTAEGGIYRSSSWSSSEWIDFPPGIAVRFEHKLGEEPRAWQAYVATAREGDGSNLVLATGSEAELVDIDDEAVTVRNATCVDFFIVMVAMSAVE
ncbi:MAG: hypothetical protein HOW73_41860 [Polyangiaceae bacterium]|nr:hypothetical protein [Polyangiaceae bacterium]